MRGMEGQCLYEGHGGTVSIRGAWRDSVCMRGMEGQCLCEGHGGTVSV